MRHDDLEQKSYFRSSDRIFHINGAWYFATREGDQGPFPTEAQVKMEIRRFITEKTELAHFQQGREDKRKRNLANAEFTLSDVDGEPTLELLPSRDRPRMRPTQPILSKRKVYV